LVTPLEDL
jgi:hypothetical protein